MKIYGLRCKTNTDNIDPKMFKTKNNRLIMWWKCSVKEQEAKGLLSQLGIKTPLSKIPLLYVLF